MPTLNVQADVRKRLEDALSPVEVRVRAPADCSVPLVVVYREGGARENTLVDRAGIRIYCWAKTEQEAFELADAACDVIDALPFSGGYADVFQESFYSDPDPDSRLPRWTASYTVATYVPPK
ncbi:hypothetical protein [Adlercreutzia sp. ZJ141]|uniref:hypothetical protein n=1 Tax=Adlercreutzia sp. ZJ141 TaxID=2709406 RepID=UPI0013E9B6C7|nr:hypothetical protein [Adlercreutzia sp. ZJ141]